MSNTLEYCLKRKEEIALDIKRLEHEHRKLTIKINHPYYLRFNELLIDSNIVNICLSYLQRGWCNDHGEYFGDVCSCKCGVSKWKLQDDVIIEVYGFCLYWNAINIEDEELYKYCNPYNCSPAEIVVHSMDDMNNIFDIDSGIPYNINKIKIPAGTVVTWNEKSNTIFVPIDDSTLAYIESRRVI